MAFKPNYGMQRADRSRSREAKREEKLRQRQERSNERKGQTPVAGEDDAPQPDSAESVPAGRPGEPRKP